MFKINHFLSATIVLIVSYFVRVNSHGMMLEPVNRASLWRYDPTAPRDYNDNGAYCGGYSTQWAMYDGNCGLCGDSYGDATPRAHEYGGVFGKGVIVRNYTAGESAEINVKITTNHKGYFLFHLCNIDSSLESEECFSAQPLLLQEGGYKYRLPSFENGMFSTIVVIPSDVTCNHCVLRWTYITGNSWGTCPDGSGALGCGPQEEFKGCADVAIFSPDDDLYNEIPY